MLSRLLAALRFLTFVPVPGDRGASEAALERSKPFFPLVGLLIGASAVLLARALDGLLLPPPVSATVLVAFLVTVSRGLHADGLADTADGFFSSRSRERILEIMRDSRIGTMGALAVLFVVLLKWGCLSSLGGVSRDRALLIAPLSGRAAIVQMLATLPYVRQDGLGTLFYRTSSRSALLVSLALLLATGLAGAGLRGLAAGTTSIFVTVLFCRYCRNKIGGATGDTLGAACELAEVVPLVLFASRL